MAVETLWGPVKRDRQEALAFLKAHFRYSTMNNWNGITSYAVNVKVHRLGLSQAERAACYEMLAVQEAWDASGYNDALKAFAEAHGWRWQIGTNGRSGGYLVLYQGKRIPSEYKTVCRMCGQKHYTADAKKCGCCGAAAMQPYKGHEVRCFPGRGTDDDVDFDEMDDDWLDERMDLVVAFDEACAEAVRRYVAFAMNNEGVVETMGVST